MYNLLLRRVRGSLLRRVLHSRMAFAAVEMVEPFCLHRWHGSAPSHRCLEIAHCWHAFAIRVIVVTIVDVVYRDASDARVSSSTNEAEMVSHPNAEACVLSVRCSRCLKCSAHVVQFSLAFGEVRGRSRSPSEACLALHSLHQQSRYARLLLELRIVSMFVKQTVRPKSGHD